VLDASFKAEKSGCFDRIHRCRYRNNIKISPPQVLGIIGKAQARQSKQSTLHFARLIFSFLEGFDAPGVDIKS